MKPFSQEKAIRYIQDHPGCSKLDCVRACYPWSIRLGYQVLDRLIEKGRIEAKKTGNKYQLYLK